MSPVFGDAIKAADHACETVRLSRWRTACRHHKSLGIRYAAALTANYTTLAATKATLKRTINETRLLGIAPFAAAELHRALTWLDSGRVPQ